MHCPICKINDQHALTLLRAKDFSEQLLTCSICGSSWAVHMGVTGLIKDGLECSFLEAHNDAVENDAYGLAA